MTHMQAGLKATGPPSIAVITVSWNALADLQATCASVQAQQYEPLLHVVVDGGSCDGTREWLESRREQFAIAICEPDHGIYDAMNKALDRCPPVDWVIFLNAGDVFSSNQLLELLHPVLLQDTDFVFGDVTIRSTNGRSARTFKARLRARTEMPGCHQSCLVRAELMKSLHFDQSYKVAGDFECWLRATHKHGGRSGFFDGVIACIAPEGFSAHNEALLQKDYVRAISTHVGGGAATAWLCKRKLRQLALHLRAATTRGTRS